MPGNAEIGRRNTDLVEDMGLDMCVGRMAIRTQIKVGTVGAVPPNASDGPVFASIASNTAMNDALMSCTIFCYMIQGSLKGLAFCIAGNLLLPVASLGRWYASDVVDGSALSIEN